MGIPYFEKALSTGERYSEGLEQSTAMSLNLSPSSEVSRFISAAIKSFAVDIVSADYPHAAHICFRVGAFAVDQLRSALYSRRHMARVFEVRLRNAIVTGKRVDIRKHGAEYVTGIVFVAYERKTQSSARSAQLLEAFAGFLKRC